MTAQSRQQGVEAGPEKDLVRRSPSLSRSLMSEQLPRVRFTPKQRLFIEAYLISKNATKAAIAAGFSERSANNQGTRLMANDAIRGEIEARLAATFDRYAVTSDRIIRELALIAFGNIGDFIEVQADGSLVVDFGTATREQMASLKSVEIDKRPIAGAAAGVRRVKINLSDKRQALMDLAKIARMLPADRHEHSGSIDHHVKPEHKIDIESMDHEEREQLRETLLKALAEEAKFS
jgi:phage terminase small subunit